MVNLNPNRKKLPVRRMIIYLLIFIILLIIIIFWNHLLNLLVAR